MSSSCSWPCVGIGDWLGDSVRLWCGSAHKSLVNEHKVTSELHGITVFIQACKKAAVVAYTFYVDYFKNTKSVAYVGLRVKWQYS